MVRSPEVVAGREDDDKAPNNFPCPDCGTKLVVKDSRKTDEGVRRRRACPKCRARFTTYEVIVQRGNRVLPESFVGDVGKQIATARGALDEAERVLNAIGTLARAGRP